ncbi:MAG: Dabb family protein [bacterium]
MTKHIVFWKFKDTADGHTKEENLQEAKRLLEGMQGKIPGLLKTEVGINVNSTPQALDLALYSEFDSMNTLQIYQDHPEHVKVKEFLQKVRTDRWVVDYEV